MKVDCLENCQTAGTGKLFAKKSTFLTSVRSKIHVNRGKLDNVRTENVKNVPCFADLENWTENVKNVPYSAQSN